MHEELLYRAARPAPAIVLGLLLKPYSIGHELSLIASGNPLAHSDKATPAQLAEAAFICCQNWRESQRSAVDPLQGLKLWAWKVRLRLRRKIPFESDLAMFAAYRSAGSLEFPLSELGPNMGEEARPLGCPPLLRLQAFIMRELEMPEEKAWDYHYGLAKMRWAEWHETQGTLSIYNWAEYAHDQAVAQRRAAQRKN